MSDLLFWPGGNCGCRSPGKVVARDLAANFAPAELKVVSIIARHIRGRGGIGDAGDLKSSTSVLRSESRRPHFFVAE